MHCPARTILAVVLASLTVSVCRADDTTASDVYKKALPSVMTLEFSTADGGGTGTGFLAIKDGLAITAWHVCKGATSMKAKFADGEVDDVTGVVDKDEANDVAIIRVKESGRAMLQLRPDNPDIGSKAYALGAPRGLDFSISDGIISQMREVDGGQKLQFTTPISPGNSGGPLMASDASVIGVVVSTRVDAQNVNFAVPIRKILALDPTLPTTPWASVASKDRATSISDDQAIGDALVAWSDAGVGYDLAFMEGGGQGYQNGVSSEVYDIEIRTGDAIDKIDEYSGENATTTKLLKDLRFRLERIRSSIDLLSKSIQSAHSVGTSTSVALNYFREAQAARASESERPLPDELQTWIHSDYATKRFSPAQLSVLGFTPGKTNIRFTCAGALLKSPNTILGVYHKGLAEKLGLKSNDTIVSANGVPITCLEDLKELIDKSRDQKMTIMVERDGEQKELDTKIPKNPEKE